MKKLVIIPAYNECRSILKAVDDIKIHAPDFDYVVINDCSTDGTLDICRKYGLNHVNLSVNLGIGGAVQTGYIYACQYDYDAASRSWRRQRAIWSLVPDLSRKKAFSPPDSAGSESGIFPH